VKAFNWKIAARVFLALLALDGILLALSALDNSIVDTLWWTTNFPGFPILYLVLVVFPPDTEVRMIVAVGAAGLFSLVFWSALAGYLFRIRRARTTNL
jgi:hypothetical protein